MNCGNSTGHGATDTSDTGTDVTVKAVRLGVRETDIEEGFEARLLVLIPNIDMIRGLPLLSVEFVLVYSSRKLVSHGSRLPWQG